MEIRKNKSLRHLNTFQVGGEAEFYSEIRDKENLAEAIEWAKKEGQKISILGGGSNILVPDDGVKGLVLRILNDERQVRGARLSCGAGTTLAQAAGLAQANGLSGLEWTVGIPRATIGGAIRGNAGAFGTEMKDLVEIVLAFDKERMVFDRLSTSMCAFSYRNSVFKNSPNYIIWEATLRLTENDGQDIAKKMRESLEFRTKRYPNLPSAGSVFENLMPDQAERENKELFDTELKQRIGREGRISAGLLIDMAGLKGKTIGGAKISLEHANHIVNTGNCRAEDIIMLVSYVKQQVRDRFGIQLHEEFSYFGF